jgi:glyoxylase-like metal-dependent hydrolase (beta-lactamase superfamily II)
MTDSLTFDRTADDRYGRPVELAPQVRRVLARNPGPFTFTGTASHIVGRGEVAVIDPGPADPAHLAALLEATRGERISHILVTHTHRDHTGGLAALRAATGATVAGCAPHHAARPLGAGEVSPLDASNDTSYAPDLVLGDGMSVAGSGWTLTAVPTPGHTANHLAFAFPESNVLFPGDHVMGWSTTIVAPPDGSMADYMASLDRLEARGETIYLPAHGMPVTEPHRFIRALKGHRRAREAQILKRLAMGDRTVPEIVRAAYAGLDPRLTGAAGLSVLAHLEDLVARGLVVSEEPVRVDGHFVPV